MCVSQGGLGAPRRGPRPHWAALSACQCLRCPWAPRARVSVVGVLPTAFLSTCGQSQHFTSFGETGAPFSAVGQISQSLAQYEAF